ncbi:MAG: ribonuclease Z [Prevotellaceae bacterium]|nr:ribonuclease Z [Prevotellaceae bacterium]MDY3364788.1 ribonuclease Z [Prevotella sp.]
MEPFRVHILGCGSALPTLRHHASSQVVEIREKLFMIDCGEGTQMQLRRSRIRFTKVSAVFISHLHGDHCFGLLGMISTFGMLGRTASLKVYAPAEYEDLFHRQMEFFCSNLEFEVEFCPIDTTQNVVVYEDKSLTVETIPLEHRVACCGFLFREKPTLPHIRRDMLDYYQIPVSQVNNIKLGADWVMPDGEIIPNSRLTRPADKARSYAYCSDTRYMPRLHKMVTGVDTLYHEATYDKSFEGRARMYYHSTAEQAAKVARDAAVGKLVLGHFSARYEDESVLMEEAQQIFPHCVLANEGVIIDV